MHNNVKRINQHPIGFFRSLSRCLKAGFFQSLPKLVTKRAEQILKSLEDNADNKKIISIEDDLPLFSVFQNTEKKEEVSPLDEALKNLNPDNLTPREALDKLYELKSLYLNKEQ